MGIAAHDRAHDRAAERRPIFPQETRWNRGTLEGHGSRRDGGCRGQLAALGELQPVRPARRSLRWQRRQQQPCVLGLDRRDGRGRGRSDQRRVGWRGRRRRDRRRRPRRRGRQPAEQQRGWRWRSAARLHRRPRPRAGVRGRDRRLHRQHRGDLRPVRGVSRDAAGRQRPAPRVRLEDELRARRRWASERAGRRCGLVRRVRVLRLGRQAAVLQDRWRSG